jgi:hypothetical protein
MKTLFIISMFFLSHRQSGREESKKKLNLDELFKARDEFVEKGNYGKYLKINSVRTKK